MDVTTCMMVKGQELQCVCVCLLRRLGGRGVIFPLHVAAAHHQWSERQHSGIFYTPIHRGINSLTRPPFLPHTCTHSHTHTQLHPPSKKKKREKKHKHQERGSCWEVKSRLSCWSCLLLWNFLGNLPFQSSSLRDERVAKEAGGDGRLICRGAE